MSKKYYNKEWKSVKEQIQFLVSNGMIIRDEELAQKYLAHTNYYRLSGYWFTYKIRNNKGKSTFAIGTRFEEIINLFEFDSSLRKLVFGALEIIEISVRSKMAHIIGRDCDKFPFKPENFDNAYKFKEFKSTLISTYSNSTDQFSEHLKNKYEEELPPIWAHVEIMIFGDLIKTYSNFKSFQLKKRIALEYGINNHSVFSSWLNRLVTIRNFCAHHARLWNRKLQAPIFPNSKASSVFFEGWSHTIDNSEKKNHRRIYNVLLILGYLLDQIGGEQDWLIQIRDCILSHNIDVKRMGFPKNWLDLEILKD